MAIPTDSHVIESPFAPRRQRWVRYPWLARTDRVRSIPNLNHGLIDRRQLPLQITPYRDWIAFGTTWDMLPLTDRYLTGPFVLRGSHVRYALIDVSNEPFPMPTGGWRLYFTRTAPAAIGDLLDHLEVFPCIRDAAGDPVPSVRWGTGYPGRISPRDHVKHFPGYYSFRFTTENHDYGSVHWRMIIEQPCPPI